MSRLPSMSGDALPFDGMTVWSLLDTRADATPDRPFFTWVSDGGDSVPWSYRRFRDTAANVAVGLQQRGVDPGDRVLIHLENCPEFLLTWFACAAMGAVAVTTNPRATADELAFFAEHVGAVGAVTQPRLFETVRTNAPALRFVVSIDEDPVRAGAVRPPAGLEHRFSSLFGEAADLRPPALTLNSPMNILFTSGTTSRPKAVIWTHGNGLWTAKISAAHENLQPDDVHLVCLPLFHINGMGCQMLATLWVGGSAVLVSKWSTSRFWDLSQTYGCTWLPLVPFTAQALREMPARTDHSYRAFSARAAYPELAERFGVRMDGWFGMTETVTQVIVSDAFGPTPANAIGRPAVEYGIRIVKADETVAGPDEPGELRVRGVPGISLFAGYFGDEAATAAAYDADGYFRTGDIVRQDTDGVVHYVERLKDILKVGGETVAPADIERVVLETGLVREVAVVARRHAMLEEIPVAYVVTDGDPAQIESQILAACRVRLASFKVPHAVIVVSELPKTSAGKVRKVELRTAAASIPDEQFALRGERDPAVATSAR